MYVFLFSLIFTPYHIMRESERIRDRRPDEKYKSSHWATVYTYIYLYVCVYESWVVVSYIMQKGSKRIVQRFYVCILICEKINNFTLVIYRFPLNIRV